MPIRLAAIVEGHGEREAVPLLVRRIAAAVDPSLVVEVRPVLRIPASRLLREGELERQVELAGRWVAPHGAILVLLDCHADGSCPAVDGPNLLERMRAARPDLATSVVLAKKEFEAWFLASATSLRGHRRLAQDLTPPLRRSAAPRSGSVATCRPTGRTPRPPTSQRSPRPLTSTTPAQQRIPLTSATARSRG